MQVRVGDIFLNDDAGWYSDERDLCPECSSDSEESSLHVHDPEPVVVLSISPNGSSLTCMSPSGGTFVVPMYAARSWKRINEDGVNDGGE
jgi:hypothetical protein